MSPAARSEERTRTAAIFLIGVFFGFGAFVSALTAVMLEAPGSYLDPLWRLNPSARVGFQAMGIWAVPLLAVVCAACAIAAAGLWRLAPWGWWTAVTVLSINLAGDLANTLISHNWRTLIGLPIGGAMLAYLITRRNKFAASDERIGAP